MDDQFARTILTEGVIEEFGDHLRHEEKSPATVEKYLRDARAFVAFARAREGSEGDGQSHEERSSSDGPLGDQFGSDRSPDNRPAGDRYDARKLPGGLRSSGPRLTKELVLAWKRHLVEAGYAPRSVNSMLSSVHGLLDFMGRQDCRVKNLRLQRSVYLPEQRELSLGEYRRLVEAAASNPRLQLIVQTICATGIRVSELPFFTVEAVQRGEVRVACKGKTRIVIVPKPLCHLLLEYARERGIRDGAIFRTGSGRPIDRSNVWSAMKGLCREADVEPSKVFPHNLRKLFARTFYEADKDIAKLADVLGHCSIDTTRIYVMSSGSEHRRMVEGLGLVVTAEPSGAADE